MDRIFTTAKACEMAFYAAFNSFDAGQMGEVWALDHAVWCVHPTSPVLLGRDAVMSSWKEIFATPAPASMQLQISDHQVIETADLAVRFVHENIHHGPGLQMVSVVQATNVFVREGQGWKMCSHHASPAPSPSQIAASRPREQSGTMH